MSAGIWFWLIYVILFLFGIILGWPANLSDRAAWRPLGRDVVILILLGLLGWGLFGPPIK